MPRRDPERRTDAYESIFTALAHPVRRRILITVNFSEDGSITAGEIAAIFEHSWPTTTRHLRALERAGLIRQERRGRERHDRLVRKRLSLVHDWIAWFFKDPR